MRGKPGRLVVVGLVHVKVDVGLFGERVVLAQAVKLAQGGGGLLLLESVERAEGLRPAPERLVGCGHQLGYLRESRFRGAGSVES